MTRNDRGKNPEADPYNLTFLKRTTRELGYKLHYFPEIENTMMVIDDLARQQQRNYFVAVADHQTKGVGRKGRIWYDTPGCSLMFSVLYHIKDSHIAIFSDLVALKVCQALRKLLKNTVIKIQYPNDLVIHDKKFGGILVKNVYNEDLKYLGTSIGVGINIHYTQEVLSEFSTDYQATSVDDFTDFSVKRQDLLIGILRSLSYLDVDTDVISVNSHARLPYNKEWKQISSLIKRQVVLLKQNKPVEKGTVMDTKLGNGIQLMTVNGLNWFSLFESDMKVRVLS